MDDATEQRHTVFLQNVTGVPVSFLEIHTFTGCKSVFDYAPSFAGPAGC